MAAARLMATNLEVFVAALRYRLDFDLETPDAIILATVVADLQEQRQSGPHYFANRNRNDFDIPGIQNLLRSCDCTLVNRFREVVLLLDV
jgi:hypothetical protein